MAGGRAVLVTGGSRGIGAAVARAFANAGDRVAVHYSANPDKARQVADELEGDGHTVVGADLRDPDAIKAMVDEAAQAFGGIDVLAEASTSSSTTPGSSSRTRSTGRPTRSGSRAGATRSA
jgi:NAD(P)-dependent dehydrogenase (short-subunit alcohol dehydrogenase family)